MTHSVDKRIIKTKKAICNALIELLSMKPFTDITITDIAKKANVNRKTIYNYYSGIHQILEDIEDKLSESLENVLKDIDIRSGLSSPVLIYKPITDLLNENIDFYKHLLNINMNLNLVNRITAYLNKRVKEFFAEQQLFDETRLDLISHFIVSSFVDAYSYWFNNNLNISLEDFSKEIHNYLYNGIKNYIK